MQSIGQRFAEPAHYRVASIVLLIIAVGLPIAFERFGAPVWFSFLVGAPAYIALIIFTYHRLRDAALSGGWVVLMILTFNVGPSWEVPGSLTLYLGNLVNLVPIVLAWTVPTKAGANPRPVEVR